MTARYLVGDVFDRMAEIPDGSIDLIITSPPFLALRSYLPDDHPNKAKEIGSEGTPAGFLRVLLDLTREWRRVLAPHGSIAVELGDTYAGTNSTGWHRSGDEDPDRYRALDAVCAPSPKDGAGWPLDKSLCGIPTLYAWSLAYGHNLLDPTQQLEPWRIRNLLSWSRPNPPVGALGDKWRPATSYVTVACVGRQRYFDLDAVRGAYSENTHARTAKAVDRQERTAKTSPDGNRSTLHDVNNNGAGAPPLDWCDEQWQPLIGLPTQPYAGAHFATFPSQLPARIIECMAPRRVCVECGKPSVRITSEPEYVQTSNGAKPAAMDLREGVRVDKILSRAGMSGDTSVSRRTETLGWSDCGHNQWRRGLILDPFAGSGTTLLAATGAGRDAIGIDLDHRNADLAQNRVGMFLEIVA